MYREAEDILFQRNLLNRCGEVAIYRPAAQIAAQVRDLHGLPKKSELPARLYMYCKERIKGMNRVEAYQYAQVADIKSFLA